MPSLVSSDDTVALTGAQYDLFLTVARNVTIFKQPKENYTSASPSVYAGYGTPSEESNITYTPVSGIYLAQIKYKDEQNQDPILHAQTDLSKGRCRIKLTQSGHDYISFGKNEGVFVDGDMFNFITDARVQNYLGLNFYVYYLERTS